jgi:N-methylhydantoinase B/oxoprolinase/acetone carboxylase alpha subunit
MPASVEAAVRASAHLVPPLAPGDQIILNDPYAGGTHLNDITLVAPCFVPRRDGTPALAGWAANRAHHADVGGMVPGSIPPEATEIHQEGLRIPPVRLTPEVTALLVAASRTPAERRGDLDAQLGANVVGVEGLAAIWASLDDQPAALDAVLDHGERHMRAAVAALPDGRWHFRDVLDSAGPHREQQRPIVVR